MSSWRGLALKHSMSVEFCCMLVIVFFYAEQIAASTFWMAVVGEMWLWTWWGRTLWNVKKSTEVTFEELPAATKKTLVGTSTRLLLGYMAWVLCFTIALCGGLRLLAPRLAPAAGGLLLSTFKIHALSGLDNDYLWDMFTAYGLVLGTGEHLKECYQQLNWDEFDVLYYHTFQKTKAWVASLLRAVEVWLVSVAKAVIEDPLTMMIATLASALVTLLYCCIFGQK